MLQTVSSNNVLDIVIVLMCSATHIMMIFALFHSTIITMIEQLYDSKWLTLLHMWSHYY